MRLPRDSVLIVLDAPPAKLLLEVWREEGLSVVWACGKPERRDGELQLSASTESAFADRILEAALDANGATTLVIVGATGSRRVAATIRAAVALGYRVFWVAAVNETRSLPGARAVGAETAIAAARRARARERWKAARQTASL